MMSFLLYFSPASSVHSMISGSLHGVNRIRDGKQHQPLQAQPSYIAEQQQNAPLVDDTDSFIYSNHIIPQPAVQLQLEDTADQQQQQQTWSSHTTSPSFSRVRVRPYRREHVETSGKKSFLDKATMFYSTTITKYWLSLTFRILYLLALSYTVASPGCGPIGLNVFIWLWALMWLVEDLLLLNAQETSLGEVSPPQIDLGLSNLEMDLKNPWSVLNVVFLSSLLLIILAVKIVATYIPTLNVHDPNMPMVDLHSCLY